MRFRNVWYDQVDIFNIGLVFDLVLEWLRKLGGAENGFAPVELIGRTLAFPRKTDYFV